MRSKTEIKHNKNNSLNLGILTLGHVMGPVSWHDFGRLGNRAQRVGFSNLLDF